MFEASHANRSVKGTIATYAMTENVKHAGLIQFVIPVELTLLPTTTHVSATISGDEFP